MHRVDRVCNHLEDINKEKYSENIVSLFLLMHLDMLCMNFIYNAFIYIPPHRLYLGLVGDSL